MQDKTNWFRNGEDPEKERWRAEYEQKLISLREAVDELESKNKKKDELDEEELSDLIYIRDQVLGVTMRVLSTLYGEHDRLVVGFQQQKERVTSLIMSDTALREFRRDLFSVHSSHFDTTLLPRRLNWDVLRSEGGINVIRPADLVGTDFLVFPSNHPNEERRLAIEIAFLFLSQTDVRSEILTYHKSGSAESCTAAQRVLLAYMLQLQKGVPQKHWPHIAHSEYRMSSHWNDMSVEEVCGRDLLLKAMMVYDTAAEVAEQIKKHESSIGRGIRKIGETAVDALSLFLPNISSDVRYVFEKIPIPVLHLESALVVRKLKHNSDPTGRFSVIRAVLEDIERSLINNTGARK